MHLGYIAGALLAASSIQARSITNRRSGNSNFLAGLNIAGLDFGADISAIVTGTYVAPPTNQISHFIKEGVSVIRLPFLWQYMEPNGPGTGLDSNFFGLYDSYVQSALDKGAHVIVDVHNYARFNGGIIGQGGPSNAEFAALWSELAKKYASKSQVIFGIMNEPHDLPSLTDWAGSVQAAVNAIRQAGARTQTILLPGTGFTGAGSFLNTNLEALSAITDPAGGTGLLVFDIHQYLDPTSAGTSPECSSDHVSDLFTPITDKLISIGRKAFLSETGGGNNAPCVTYLGNALAYIEANSAAWLGFTAWSAGSFDQSYALSLTPNRDGSDQQLFSEAIVPHLPNRSSKVKRMNRHQGRNFW